MQIGFLGIFGSANMPLYATSENMPWKYASWSTNMPALSPEFMSELQSKASFVASASLARPFGVLYSYHNHASMGK